MVEIGGRKEGSKGKRLSIVYQNILEIYGGKY